MALETFENQISPFPNGLLVGRLTWGQWGQDSAMTY
jgi:hypothetical protein